jgi:hypothetical protein
MPCYEPLVINGGHHRGVEAACSLLRTFGDQPRERPK